MLLSGVTLSTEVSYFVLYYLQRLSNPLGNLNLLDVSNFFFLEKASAATFLTVLCCFIFLLPVILPNLQHLI